MCQEQQGHPIFAAFWQRVHHAFDPLREDLIAQAQGKVLEIGAGAGANLGFYHPDRVQEVTLTEPDPFMYTALEEAVRQTTLPVTLINSGAESLPFEANQFSTVVSTLVLCSVTSLSKALSEIHRVLKPGGSFLFLEHVRSGNPAIAKIQDALTPLNKRLAAGCHLNRPTLEAMTHEGFNIVSLEKPTPWFPVYKGIAQTASESNVLMG